MIWFNSPLTRGPSTARSLFGRLKNTLSLAHTANGFVSIPLHCTKNTLVKFPWEVARSHQGRNNYALQGIGCNLQLAVVFASIQITLSRVFLRFQISLQHPHHIFFRYGSRGLIPGITVTKNSVVYKSSQKCPRYPFHPMWTRFFSYAL